MDYKVFLSQLNVATQLPFSVVNDNGETIYCVPETEHHFLPPILLHGELDLLNREALDEQRPRMKIGHFSALIGALKLPEGGFLVVGPCASKDIALADVVGVVPDFVSRDDVMSLYHVYQQTSLTDPARFASVLALLARTIYGKELTATEILTDNFPTEKPEMEALPLTAEVSLESVILFENRVRSAVRNGNRQELDAIWARPLSLIMENFDHRQENEKYFVIPYLTLVSRAAIDGGAVSRKVFETYDAYTRLFLKASNTGENYTLVVESSYAFCDLVRESGGVDMHSELCSICEKYINDHIAEKITAQDLARACNVDRSDIFDIFRSNFHISLTEYIQRERLRRAELLMLNTSYTIGQVSAALGFVSQGYFSKVFAKYHGCTPGEFRTRNIRN